jgi:hypothetical protein
MATEAASVIVTSHAAASDAHDGGERRALLKRIVSFFGPFPPG